MEKKNKTTLPALPWSGGCQCGALRYEITGKPITFYACHCTECQHQSASMHGLSIWVREADYHLNGEPARWSRTTDSGNLMDCMFCPTCGTRLYHKIIREQASPRDGVLVLKAGSLDHARLLVPVGHIWTKSKSAGAIIPDGVLTSEAGPEDFTAYVEAFSEAYEIPG